MRYIKQLSGVAALFSVGLCARAEVIPFKDLPLSAAQSDALGIQIQPTGPESIPLIQGEMEVLGLTTAFDTNSVTSRYYSGTATLDRPANRLTFDVARGNNSGWEDPITLIAFDNGKRVAATTIDLPPLGESAKVTLSAPAIDHFAWSGNGWVYHPYYLRDFQVTFDAVTSKPSVSSVPPGNVPSVGASVPEPASAGIVFAGLVVLGRYRRPRGGCAANPKSVPIPNDE